MRNGLIEGALDIWMCGRSVVGTKPRRVPSWNEKENEQQQEGELRFIGSDHFYTYTCIQVSLHARTIGISTIATTAGLCMVKVDIVAFVIGLREAVVAQDTGFIGLTGTTHPDNIVFAKGVLTYPTGHCFSERDETL